MNVTFAELEQTAILALADKKARVSESRYIPQLDGLRALAVSLVLVYHWLRPDCFINLGQLGVSLFFVLSGYLITSILLRCRDTANYGTARVLLQIKVFYIRRFLRIFPVYYATLAVGYFVGFDVIRETWPWHVT